MLTVIANRLKNLKPQHVSGRVVGDLSEQNPWWRHESSFWICPKRRTLERQDQCVYALVVDRAFLSEDQCSGYAFPDN